MLSKRFAGLFAAAIVTASMFSASALTTFLGVRVNADEKKIEEIFEDKNLQDWVKKNVDSNNNGYLSQSEIDSVRSADIRNKSISNISGLEIFTKMTELECSGNHIKEFDSSLFPQLTYLDIGANDLNYLIVGNMPDLEYLYCNSNSLMVLNISKNKKLTRVNAIGNDLSFFNAGNNTSMIELLLSNNDLDEVKIDGLSKLQVLDVSLNDLKYLDVTRNSSLTSLNCSYCSFDELDVRNNSEISSLIAEGTKLSSLDLSNLKKLTYLSCSGEIVPDLDLKNNTRLNTVVFTEFGDELDLSNMPNLHKVGIYKACLDELNFNNVPALETLYIGNSTSCNLDLKEIKNLKELICNNNCVCSIDVSSNEKLEYFECSNNSDLTSIDVSSNHELKVLVCSGNKFTSLDISRNEKLEALECTGNKLKSLAIYNNPVLINAYGAVKRAQNFYTTDNGGYLYVWDGFMSSDVGYWRTIYDGFTCDPDVEIITTAPSTPANPTTPVSPSTTGGTFEDFVERLYVVALGRASEADGKAHWCKVVGNGSYSGADCARFFLTSPEFNGRNLNDEEYLKVLYKTFFDRDASADPDGFNFWLGKIGEWGRARVLEGFIDSTEWCNICADYGVRSGAMTAKATKASKNATAFATRLYTECLGREPEEGGLNYWSLSLTNQERTGTQAAKEFFYSPEFKDKNLGDEEYINRLYKTFMGREPEAEGKAYWLEQLRNGSMNRDQVFDFFSTCEEFTGICNSYAIAR